VRVNTRGSNNRSSLQPIVLRRADRILRQLSRSAFPAVDDSSRFDPARKRFAQNWASCHGESGGGDGPTAAAQALAPTNFHIQQPSVDYARLVLSEGVAGSSMPPWKHQLTEPRQLQLVD
jgi:mono/diheme cytochrome c family protein